MPNFKKIHTHPPVRHDDSASIVKFANFGYKCGEHVERTWIHIRFRIRRRAEINNEKIFSATERAVAAVPSRLPTTESKLDRLQRMACLQSTP